MILCVSQLVQMFASLGDEALLTRVFCNGKNLLLREQILSFKNGCISLVLSTCILYSELALFCDNSLTGETEPTVEFFLFFLVSFLQGQSLRTRTALAVYTLTQVPNPEGTSIKPGSSSFWMT